MLIRKKGIKQSSKKSGFTLVEAMIAAVILTITSVATLSGLLQARRMTEGSIYQATATTVAQGYIEQLKNMEFQLLDEAILPELYSQGENDQLTVSPMVADPAVGNPDTDSVNSRTIDINYTPDDDGDDLVIDFVAYVEDITDPANGVSEARRIILRWGYVDRTTGSDVPVGNTLYAVRSKIPTF